MATPSSSATSPSPPMAYLQAISASQQLIPPNVSDSLERDQRKKAVDKFMARAEIAMVTRRLRAQLAYASYKATHNISHASLRDLEVQGQTKTAPLSRSVTVKRKVVGNNAATIGPSSAGTGPQRRAGSTSMLPPASVSSPRPHTSSIIPHFRNYNEIASSQAPNLFASILATPSTNQVRTIHNPNDPPVPAPERPARSPKSRASKTVAQNKSTTRPSSKAKQLTKNSKLPDKRRKKKPTPVDKGKEKQCPDDMDVDGEMDMKAAATLTSLFLHNRPSINASPRSSIDGSEAGSSHSHSHFSQSSARTSSQNVPPFSVVMPPSTLGTEGSLRSQTPPPVGGHKRQHSTPRAAPTDSEAANLMLFLATSPSPVRTTTSKDAKDAAAFRALTGGSGPLRSKGRVLFASSSASDRDPSAHNGVPLAVAGSPYGEVPPLSRGGESSFASSISSIGADMAVSRSDGSGLQSISMAPVSLAPATPSQLLPPAPLPIPSPTEGRNDKLTTLQSDFSGIQSGGSLSSVDFFNFHEFINASPSPSRPGNGHAVANSNAMVSRSNLGLRTDVGRKLFDGEQMHVHLEAAAAATGTASAMMPPPRQEERTLGASIDLVHI